MSATKPSRNKNTKIESRARIDGSLYKKLKITQKALGYANLSDFIQFLLNEFSKEEQVVIQDESFQTESFWSQVIQTLLQNGVLTPESLVNGVSTDPYIFQQIIQLFQGQQIQQLQETQIPLDVTPPTHVECHCASDCKCRAANYTLSDCISMTCQSDCCTISSYVDDENKVKFVCSCCAGHFLEPLETIN
ncbi:hypothetical protein EIN_027580 [Entamoeba invadens IP1]|uniref:hypothetical protein n=1 Tax=Entamoeba invadens IP1 TaxID=370355 RepID=UPI0002C3E8C7|nr:hypothetical protein EIN_027580 [Entamoeba invadens IP1]ELP90829.1 hypothetical protein EIN_027580 [Entamoeba invadens IP1]|eukprot:XP_004257600.1 hypothetical protein EIN_027580 [Entamoeba invadens IP1]